MREADVIVVGAGHNSLVAAAYLALAGLDVLVLERASHPGGDTMTEEVTLPGFRHDSCASAHTLLQSNPLIRDDELCLSAHGLEYIKPDPVFTVPFLDGESLTMYRDPERTAAEIARHSAKDAAAYRQLLADWAKLAPLQAQERSNPPGTPEDLIRLWRSGELGDEGLRIRQASALDILAERFENPYVQAFVAWVAMMTLAPLDLPETGLLPFSLTAGRQQHSWTTPRGGSGALPEALLTIVQKKGGAVETDAEVVRIVLAEGRAVGVVTKDGRQFRARRAVLSSQHIKQLPTALGSALDATARAYIERWREGLTMFVTHYALAQAPVYRTWDGGHPSVAMGALESVDELLEILHDFRRGRLHLERPFLLVLNSSLADQSRAPKGQHTLKIVSVQPYQLREGPEHWDAIKEEVSERLLDGYLAYTRNLTRRDILAKHVESPLDLERRNPNNYHGSCHGGHTGFGQSGYFRPAPGWNGYRTPIEGLYLTGSCTHPGGSVSAYPGRNAARVMLADFGIAFDDVLAEAKSLARA